jgi:hypothetical protein
MKLPINGLCVSAQSQMRMGDGICWCKHVNAITERLVVNALDVIPDSSPEIPPAQAVLP